MSVVERKRDGEKELTINQYLFALALYQDNTKPKELVNQPFLNVPPQHSHRFLFRTRDSLILPIFFPLFVYMCISLGQTRLLYRQAIGKLYPLVR